MNAIATVNAPLPASYEAAKSALAQCQAIDECKEWADKAAALASYARQSEDLELEKMAARIRARAMRRAGELLKQIEPQQGGDRGGGRGNQGGGVSPMVSRKQAMADAGMSVDQGKTALRVASIPERQFTEQVESANPPTLTELARQGTQKREMPPDPETWLKGRDPKVFNAILHMSAAIEQYAKEAEAWKLTATMQELNDEERANIRRWIVRIDAVHDQIMTRI